jgi:hypothetical protein
VRQAVLGVLDRETWDRYVRAEGVERQHIIQNCEGWNSILRPDQK